MSTFFTKQGLSIIRIVSIFLISVALILQVTAVAADKWSEIDSDYRGLPIKAFQSLWTERVLLDKPRAYPRPKNMENDWKRDLQIIEIMCIFVGLVPLTLLLVLSFVTIIAKKIVLAAVFRALAIIMTIIASLLIVVGALLFNYQKVKMFSYNARNPASSYPVNDERVSYGFLLSVISGVLLALGAVLEISQLIIADAKRSSLSQVQPSDESVKENSDEKC